MVDQGRQSHMESDLTPSSFRTFWGIFMNDARPSQSTEDLIKDNDNNIFYSLQPNVKWTNRMHSKEHSMAQGEN